MAAQKQEVELLIKAGTEGVKSIGQLLKELEALGEDTGEASAQLQGLASSLAELKSQQALVKQFADLKSQTRQLAQEQAEAKERATALGKALADTEKPTKAQRREFEQAKKASRAANEAWQSNQQQLNELRGTLDGAGISTRDLAGEQVRIKKEIAGVNQAAEAMAGELRQVKESAEGAGKGADKAAKSTKDLGNEAEKSRGLLSKLGGGLKAVATGATALIAGVGASAATLSLFSRSQATVADDLTNTANAINESRQALQVWQIAGDRVGLSGEKVSDILRSVTERLGEFSANGGGEAADVMERLNLKIEDFRGLRPSEQMLKFAEAIETLPNDEQVALLEKLASDASQLQPLLDDNAAGLRAIAEEAEQSGALYSEEELDKLLRANDIYNSITLKVQGLTRRIGAELAPVVADATDKVVGLFEQNEGGQKLIDLFKRITQWGAEMAVKLVENSESISAGFGTLWNTIQAGASGAMAIFRGLQTIVSGWATLVAGSFATVLSIAEGLAVAMNKVGLVSDETLSAIRAKADAARETVVELGKQTVEYGRQAVEAGKDVVSAFEPAKQTLQETEQETKKAGEALVELQKKTQTAGDESQKSAEGARELAKAYRDLGVTSQQELDKTAESARGAFEQIKQSGSATKRELSEAFKVYAQAIIDTGDKAKIRALEAEAASLGLRDALKEVKTQAEESGDALGTSAEDAEKKLEKAADEAERLGKASKDAGKDLDEAAETGGQAFDWFGAIISAARKGVYKLSTAARNLFEQRTGMQNFAKDAETAKDSLARVDQELGRVASSLGRVGAHEGFTRWALELEQKSLQVQKAFFAQAVAMDDLVASVNAGSYSMGDLATLSQRAASRFNLLDQQRLDGLQSAIESARNKLDSLNSSADNTLNSLRQRLAEISGDTEEAQRIQYEAERKRLQEQLEQARQAGADEAAADYQQSLDTLEKIYQIEQKNRREEQNAREKEAADRARDQQLAEIERQRAERERNTTTNRQQSVQSRPSQTIVLQTPNGGQTEIQTSDPDSFLAVLEEAGLRSL